MLINLIFNQFAQKMSILQRFYKYFCQKIFFLKNSFLLSNPQYPFDKDTPDTFVFLQAGVAKLVDAPDLGSGAARRGGSSPSTRTT